MTTEILIIDDNPDIRFLICNILKEKNFNVRSAANYDQACLEINKKLPDSFLVMVFAFSFARNSAISLPISFFG